MKIIALFLALVLLVIFVVILASIISSLKIRKKPKGFTLIELMIVIVILGILMGTILPRLSGSSRSSQLENGDISESEYCEFYGSFRTESVPIKCLRYFK